MSNARLGRSKIQTGEGTDMAKPIQWEASLTKAKAKAGKEEKLILMDYYNNL